MRNRVFGPSLAKHIKTRKQKNSEKLRRWVADYVFDNVTLPLSIFKAEYIKIYGKAPKNWGKVSSLMRSHCSLEAKSELKQEDGVTKQVWRWEKKVVEEDDEKMAEEN